MQVYEEGQEGYLCLTGHNFSTTSTTSNQSQNQSQADQSSNPIIPVPLPLASNANSNLSNLSNVELLELIQSYRVSHGTQVQALESLYYDQLVKRIIGQNDNEEEDGEDEYQDENEDEVDYYSSNFADGEEGNYLIFPIKGSKQEATTTQHSPNVVKVEKSTALPAQKQESLEDANLVFHRRSLQHRYRASKARQQEAANRSKNLEQQSNHHQHTETNNERNNKDKSSSQTSDQNAAPEKHQKSKIQFKVPSMLLQPSAGPSIAKQKFQAYLRELQEKEDRELAQQFKANPIPKSSIVPKFDLLMKEKREKSRRERAKRKQELQRTTTSNSNGFLRQNNNNVKRQNQAPILSSEERELREHVHGHQFTAHNVPTRILSHGPDTQAQEEARQARIKARANQLLARSALPNRMALDPRLEPKLRKQILESREARAHLLPQHTFRPVINRTVPDFARLQEEFSRRLELVKQRQAKTSSFSSNNNNFNANNNSPAQIAIIASSENHQEHKQKLVEKVLKEIEQDEQQLKELRWPFTLTRAKVGTVAAPPPETTYQSNVVISGTKSLELWKTARLEKLRAEQEQRERERDELIERREQFYAVRERLRSVMAPVLQAKAQEEEEREEKYKAQAERAESIYKENLQMLRARIMSRPLIVEQMNMKGIFGPLEGQTKKTATFNI